MVKKLMISAGVLLLLVAALAGGLAFFLKNPADPFVSLYLSECSTCHGEKLGGTPALGPALLGTELKHGDSVAEIRRSIAAGYPVKGMPAWSETLAEAQIQSLAIYIAERRVDRLFTDFKVDTPLEIPTGVVNSEQHNFVVEVVATGIHPLPFSIASLPDGRILVTEKTQGLRVVSNTGTLSALVRGTPQVHDDAITVAKLDYGLGWLLDVAAHPDYASNGWIYLHYTDRCGDCDGFLPVSMNTVIRGRIVNGTWTDQQVIWSVEKELYSVVPDLGAGGRIAFDNAGYLYLSVGMKGGSNYHGIQDLTTPYGKIHRVHDDGRVPADNPFAELPGAFKSTWTYGHRSPQGLEFNHRSGQLWGTEMGPRGGDELNLLLPGKNYGWPLYSKGLDYDGSPVEYGKDLGIDFDMEDIQQPVVDFTPAPAISSFVFYEGDGFPGWRNNVLVGSLKATELYRVVLENNKMVHSETLLSGVARVRDVEIDTNGNILLLLEHQTGGQVVRLVPVDSGGD